MIIYKSTDKGFLGDVDSNRIHEIMVDTYFKRTLGRVSNSEVNSWRNSLTAMERIVGRSDLPSDAGIAVEYNIPATAKGYKTLQKNQSVEGVKKNRYGIKKTYRTLMTRGMKGCYVYATDEELREYLKGLMKFRNILSANAEI